MHVNIDSNYKDKNGAKLASQLIRKCVHCGFCNATCPTYQTLGDERSGPRGRISIIKDLLEGKPTSTDSLHHLDQCLLCRNCETTCPSGVQYSKIYEHGKPLMENIEKRRFWPRLIRTILKKFLLSKSFHISIFIANLFKSILPKSLRAFLPNKKPYTIPTNANLKKQNKNCNSKSYNILLFRGCVQKSLKPTINTATELVLNASNCKTFIATDSVCCGALEGHLSDKTAKLKRVKENISHWKSTIQKNKIDFLVSTASACSYEIKDYLNIDGLSEDEKKSVRDIIKITRDISELLPQIYESLKNTIKIKEEKIAFHPPCTLQHGLKINGLIEKYFIDFGYDIETQFPEKHLCCGSAGTYSILNPKIAGELRDRKLTNLHQTGCKQILTANIGCITHLQSKSDKPVKHWIEKLAEDL